MANPTTDTATPITIPAELQADIAARNEIFNIITDAEMALSRITDSELRAELADKISSIKSEMRSGVRPERLATIRTQIDAVRQQASQVSTTDQVRTQLIQQHYMDLTVEAKERVDIRSQIITNDNLNAFVRSFARDDAPPAVQEMEAQDLKTVLNTEHGKAVLRAYNAIPAETKKAVLVEAEKTVALGKKIAVDPKHADVKADVEKSALLGTSALPEVKQGLELIHEGTPEQKKQGQQMLRKSNEEGYARMARHMPYVIEKLPAADQQRLSHFGDAEHISRESVNIWMDKNRRHKADAYNNAVAKGLSTDGFSEAEKTDAAIMRAGKAAGSLSMMECVAVAARSKTMNVSMHMDNAMGNYELSVESRTQAIYLSMKKSGMIQGDDDDGRMQDMTLKSIRATIRSADEHHVALRDLDQVKGALRDTMSAEISHGMTQRGQRGLAIALSGAYAMMADDHEAAAQAAQTAGRGVRRTLEHLHIDKDKAQEIGHAVTESLKVGANAAQVAHDFNESVKKLPDNAFKAVMDIKHQMDDTRDKAADVKATHDKFGQTIAGMSTYLQKNEALRKLFDTDKDGKAEIHEIREKLEKMGIKNVEDLDRNHDGKVTLDDLKLITGIPSKAPTPRQPGK